MSPYASLFRCPLTIPASPRLPGLLSRHFEAQCPGILAASCASVSGQGNCPVPSSHQPIRASPITYSCTLNPSLPLFLLSS